MRTLPAIATCFTVLLLTGCGEPEPEKPYDPYAISDEKRAANIAAHNAEQAKFAALDYPECEQVWKDGRLTSCGTRRFLFSMEYCAKERGSGYRLDPLSAGDSWISRAGRANMQPFEERAKRMKEGDVIWEGIAYAEGDGTDSIKIVSCQMSKENLQVQGISTSLR